jgi:hypothetical protein
MHRHGRYYQLQKSGQGTGEIKKNINAAISGTEYGRIDEWRSFDNVINKAKIACEKAGMEKVNKR